MPSISLFLSWSISFPVKNTNNVLNENICVLTFCTIKDETRVNQPKGFCGWYTHAVWIIHLLYVCHVHLAALSVTDDDSHFPGDTTVTGTVLSTLRSTRVVSTWQFYFLVLIVQHDSKWKLDEAICPLRSLFWMNHFSYSRNYNVICNRG